MPLRMAPNLRLDRTSGEVLRVSRGRQTESFFPLYRSLLPRSRRRRARAIVSSTLASPISIAWMRSPTAVWNVAYQGATRADTAALLSANAVSSWSMS